jgi:isopentenyl-diphosphate delta-isomerase
MKSHAGKTEKRKADHLRICLEESVSGVGVTTGFEQYRLRHAAFPELDLADIRTEQTFMGFRLPVPLMISSMTGGTTAAGEINVRLAEAAEARGWMMGLGSMRAALEREALVSTFRVRHVAPNIPLIANLGVVQLNTGLGPDDCRRAVELAEADALVLHANALQEVFQPEGNTDFRGLLRKVEEVCSQLHVPVGIKEVGWGIDGQTARRLADAGVAFLDTAGAGGTSWSQVEKYRQPDPLLRQAAEAFADWGMPTAECIREIRAVLPGIPLIASGGLHTGVDAAIALALGADVAGFGRSLLRDAATGEDMVFRLEQVETELRIAMFAAGAADLDALRQPGMLKKRMK